MSLAKRVNDKFFPMTGIAFVLNFRHWKFEFVSHFVLRISDLLFSVYSVFPWFEFLFGSRATTGRRPYTCLPAARHLPPVACHLLSNSPHLHPPGALVYNGFQSRAVLTGNHLPRG
ncbi:MAG: hypothetical protein JXA62_01070 [Candidatus Aminicenantes bacterium]|nr:hypothetical protein [Candidatus Aminicenantes bacterium]